MNRRAFLKGATAVAAVLPAVKLGGIVPLYDNTPWPPVGPSIFNGEIVAYRITSPGSGYGNPIITLVTAKEFYARP